MFSKNACPYCVRAETILKQKGIEIEKMDGMVHRELMLEKLSHETNSTKTFPQIWLDGKYIGGHDQLILFFNSQT